MNQDPSFAASPRGSWPSPDWFMHPRTRPGLCFAGGSVCNPLFFFKLLMSVGSTEVSTSSQRRAVLLLLLKSDNEIRRVPVHRMT